MRIRLQRGARLFAMSMNHLEGIRRMLRLTGSGIEQETESSFRRIPARYPDRGNGFPDGVEKHPTSRTGFHFTGPEKMTGAKQSHVSVLGRTHPERQWMAVICSLQRQK